MAKISVMSKYSFHVCNKRSRVQYPKSFYLSDIEAARQVAARIARGIGRAVPHWESLSVDRQSNYRVEAVDETGRRVLMVPVRQLEQTRS
jgi:hypothetical protein